MNKKKVENKIFLIVGFIFTANMAAHVTPGKLILVNYPVFLLAAFLGIFIKSSFLEKRFGASKSLGLMIMLILVTILETLSMVCSIYLVLGYLLISTSLAYVEILLMVLLLGVVIHFLFLILKIPGFKKDTVRLIRNAFFLATIYPVTFAIIYTAAFILKLY